MECGCQDLKRPPRPKPKAAKEGHPEAQSQKEARTCWDLLD